MNERIEPYRVLFPIGCVFAFWGVLIWNLYAVFPGSTYPGLLHPKMMVGGFLLSFVLGFLMTAVPKMTASFPARIWEIMIAGFLSISCGTAALANSPKAFDVSMLLAMSFLFSFGGRRVFARGKSVPEFFLLVASGLFAGFLGALALTAFDFFSIENLQPIGKTLLFDALILFLVLGIGCRLVPVISGVAIRASDTDRFKSLREFAIWALLVWSSYFIQFSGHGSLGLILRAGVVTTVAFRHWRLHKPIQSQSRLARLIRVSATLVPLGLLLAASLPAYGLHMMHLTYIGGFGLMTFTVASRVTLAHGRFDLSFETESKSLFALGLFFIIAAVVRVLAPFTGPNYMNSLEAAAAVWVLGLTLWCLVFVRKMIRLGMGARGC